MLAPLRHRNLRIFFAGQLISWIGVWMQSVGQAWLVLTLTRSPFLLGVINALQWAPVLLLSLPAGVVVDRVPKRTVVMITQALFLVIALCLGVLTVTGVVRFWHVAVLATLLGMVNAFDVPARQALIVEMVGGTEDLTGAIALNSSVFNGARLIGPGLAGLIIAAWGVGVAFLVNATTYIAILSALRSVRVTASVRVAPAAGLLTGIAEGVAFIRSSPGVLRVLVTLGILSLFAINFNVIVPVLARVQLHLGASGFGFLLAAQGIGALAGSFLVAGAGAGGPRPAHLFWGPVVLCAALMALSQVAQPAIAGAELCLAGLGTVLFTASANSTVQLETPDPLRGRVMSMYAMVFNGFAPFGALLMGGMISVWGLPVGLLVGGVAALAGTLGIRGLLRPRGTPAVVPG